MTNPSDTTGRGKNRRPQSEAQAAATLPGKPDGLVMCCIQEPPTIWGLLLLYGTLSLAWHVRVDRGAWPMVAVFLGLTVLLLGLGFRRGRRAERLGRGLTVRVGDQSLVRALVAEVARLPDGGWRFTYRTGDTAREESYRHRPPEAAGAVGVAELRADNTTRWVRPAWRNRFLADADLLFDAGLQVRKVWFIVLLSWVCAAGASAGGHDIAQTWGLAAADGGVLKSLGARLLLGGGLAAAGLGFGFGMVIYGLRYVTSLRRTGADAFELQTLLGGRRPLARADFGVGPFHEGRGRTIGWILFSPIH